MLGFLIKITKATFRSAQNYDLIKCNVCRNSCSDKRSYDSYAPHYTACVESIKHASPSAPTHNLCGIILIAV